MNTIQKHTTKFAMLALAGGLLTVLAGCGQTPAERAFMMRQQQLAAQAEASSHTLGAGSQLAGHSLAAGDALGVALFEPTGDESTRLAFFRQADTAFRVAEAHEQNGTYDNWYASFDRTDDTTRIASNDDGSITPEAIADANE